MLLRISGVLLAGALVVSNALGQDGWTEFELVPGQKVVYVAADAVGPGKVYTWVPDNPDPMNDEITGTMEEIMNPTFAVEPFPTPSSGLGQLPHDNNQLLDPGWVLLQRGDEWPNETLNVNRIGPAEEGWLLIGAYGDPGEPRPLIDHIAMTQATPTTFSRTAFLSLRLTGSGSGQAMHIWRSGSTLHVEDVLVLPGTHDGIAIHTPLGGEITNVNMRRSTVYGRYQPAPSTAQGLYVNRVHGLFVEECVFWHNGWIPESCPWSGHCPDQRAAAIGSQNVYIHCHNTHNVTFLRNITADASETGWQQRPGGLGENNLSLRNPVGLVWGNNATGCNFSHLFAMGTTRHNVFIESRDIGPSARAHGISVERTKPDGSNILNNLVTKNTLGSGGTAAIFVHDDTQEVLIQRNIVFDWENAQAFAIFCKDGEKPNNIDVRDNDFQRPNGGDLVHHQVRFDEAGFSFTYEDNRYYTTTTCWFRAHQLNDSCDHLSSNECMGFQDWIQHSGETGADDQEVSYPDPSRDIKSYMESLGYCFCDDCPNCHIECSHVQPEYRRCEDPITAFMLEAIQQSKTYWREDFTAARVNCYMREGFDMTEPCLGDLTGNGNVGIPDLLELLANWGECADCIPGGCFADLTGDCNVGVPDLLALLADWGPCRIGCGAAATVPPCVDDCLTEYEIGTSSLRECLDWCEQFGTTSGFTPSGE